MWEIHESREIGLAATSVPQSSRLHLGEKARRPFHSATGRVHIQNFVDVPDLNKQKDQTKSQQFVELGVGSGFAKMVTFYCSLE